MQFDFSTITPIEIVKEVKPKGKTTTPKNPEGMKLRIFKSGEVYPSIQLVEKFNLEYGSENAQGFDVVDSREYGQYPKEAQQCVFIAAIPKESPKVDLFGSSKIEGTSVMSQGVKRPELVELLRDMYNKTHEVIINAEGKTVLGDDLLFGSKNYVDLDILVDVKVFEGLPKYYLPKVVSRGADKGKSTYVERTGIILHPLVISQVVEEVVEQVEVLEEAINE